jgi:hypothetical protein
MSAKAYIKDGQGRPWGKKDNFTATCFSIEQDRRLDLKAKEIKNPETGKQRDLIILILIWLLILAFSCKND